MQDKLVDLTAVLPLIRNNQTIALGGMTIYRRPVAFVRALLQQQPRPQNLTLLTFTAGLASDMLVGGGCVSHIRTCYFGLESFGLAPMFTKMVENGRLTIMEESEASIACGLRATVGKLGFMPSRAWQGTDLFKVRPDVKTITDPYSGETLTAFPAIDVDVAIIHVLQADRFGNAILGGNPTIDEMLSNVAKTVILTAETVVEKLEGPAELTGLPVTAVCHQPNGAWPTSCYPAYPLDGEEILRYIDACHAGEFEDYVNYPITNYPITKGKQ
ncbi:MAG: CoA transferase subunit A [Ardenticatenaceae bacterium]|nr:CoA transferase subunit A [Ardenticatenaceae bacterium]MCB8949475.1 CoA transferase subunit A [Ardenticatenaceae bacterium]